MKEALGGSCACLMAVTVAPLLSEESRKGGHSHGGAGLTGFWFAWLAIFSFLPFGDSAEEITSWSDETQQLIPFVGLVTGDRVSVRGLPSLSGEVLLAMSKGSRVKVLEKRNEWFGVAWPPQVPVFISRAYLKTGPLESQARVAGRRVHVRTGPSAAYSSLGFLGREAIVQIRSLGPEWAQIEPPDFCRGWIHQSYLTFLERLPTAKEVAG